MEGYLYIEFLYDEVNTIFMDHKLWSIFRLHYVRTDEEFKKQSMNSVLDIHQQLRV